MAGALLEPQVIAAAVFAMDADDSEDGHSECSLELSDQEWESFVRDVRVGEVERDFDVDEHDFAHGTSETACCEHELERELLDASMACMSSSKNSSSADVVGQLEREGVGSCSILESKDSSSTDVVGQLEREGVESIGVATHHALMCQERVCICLQRVWCETVMFKWWKNLVQKAQAVSLLLELP